MVVFPFAGATWQPHQRRPKQTGPLQISENGLSKIKQHRNFQEVLFCVRIKIKWFSKRDYRHPYELKSLMLSINKRLDIEPSKGKLMILLMSTSKKKKMKQSRKTTMHVRPREQRPVYGPERCDKARPKVTSVGSLWSFPLLLNFLRICTAHGGNCCLVCRSSIKELFEV